MYTRLSHWPMLSSDLKVEAGLVRLDATEQHGVSKVRITSMYKSEEKLEVYLLISAFRAGEAGPERWEEDVTHIVKGYSQERSASLERGKA